MSESVQARLRDGDLTGAAAADDKAKREAEKARRQREADEAAWKEAEASIAHMQCD